MFCRTAPGDQPSFYQGAIPMGSPVVPDVQYWIVLSIRIEESP
ncbi:hypothetical protein BN2497_3359 [Janthinobacterium sp. CG23_2]|nr:hypothetical protein BN2497_3359 [Janthinobacterium sp. CG23_2]CUU28077.1 hypothetical protein BN3177_3359 [Janthinobacterium sp. CG23_2]